MPDATIVIATRDRLEPVRQAVASALSQTATVEVLVMDDASIDGTAQALEVEFEGIRIERSDTPEGPTALRNRAMDLATSDYVVMLDDDAYFESPHTTRQALAAFTDDRIGAVALPYINLRRETHVRFEAPAGPGGWVSSVFGAGACVFRRDAFRAAGGYQENLFYQGEEGELALRLLENGYVVCLVAADRMVHWDAEPVKTPTRQFYNVRNEVLLTYQSVPTRYLVPRLVTVVLHQLLVGVRERRVRATFAGIRAAAARTGNEGWQRRPVSAPVHRLYRRLRRRGPLPIADVLDALSARPSARGDG